MRTSQHNRCGPHGFTLVELMVTMAIIGIVAGIGMVALNKGSEGRDLKGFGENLASQFSVARQRAIATQKRQRLVITSDSFAHWESADTGLAPAVTWVFIDDMSAPRDIEVSAVDNSLHFDPGVAVPAAGTNMPFEVEFLPDGRGRTASPSSFIETGWTVFLQDANNTQTRVLLYGITGATERLDEW